MDLGKFLPWCILLATYTAGSSRVRLRPVRELPALECVRDQSVPAFGADENLRPV